MSDIQLKTARTEEFPALFSQGEPLPRIQSLRIVAAIAEEIHKLHESGCWHGNVCAEAVGIDESYQVTFELEDKLVTIDPAAIDDELCPPELRDADNLQVPRDLESARKILAAHRLPVDPVWIDVYQLGVLLCRLLTNESVHHYLRSPTTKGSVPTDLQKVIDRSLGCSESERLSSAADFAVVLRERLRELDATLPDATGAKQSTSDTSPSLYGSSADPDTTPEIECPADRSQSDDLPFTQLGHYEIVGRIGHGGMGDVYKGYEKALNRTVAIKVLPSDFARQDEFVKRFYAEATAAARLIHPNIIQMYFIGEDAGHHFFAMQYVEGSSLADLLGQKGRLTVDETLAITEQALAGLSEAHGHGLVHRDIKPGNILLDSKKRRALLADFGLVKTLEAAGAKTATGVIMGTVDYIAPEQGRGHEVDSRADLYSIGVLMYHLLSGRLPFEADSPTAMIFQHVYEQPPPLAELVVDLPEQLAAIVERLLAKSPEDRYQSANGVLDDLHAFLAGQPLPSGAKLASPAPDFGSADATAETATYQVKSANGEPRQSVVIEAPRFGAEPQFPVSLFESTDTGWWPRIQDRLLGTFQQHAPEFVKELQSTQQQVDGAVIEYKRRRDHLAALIDEAESALNEMRQQAISCREEAASAQVAAEAASNDEVIRAILKTKLDAERVADELDQQAADQLEQLESMRLRLSQVRAKYEQLRSQRDLLNARLRSAEARAHVAGGRPTRHTWNRGRVILAVAAVAMCLLMGLGLLQFFHTPSPQSADSETIGDGAEPVFPPLGSIADPKDSQTTASRAGSETTPSVVAEVPPAVSSILPASATAGAFQIPPNLGAFAAIRVPGVKAWPVKEGMPAWLPATHFYTDIPDFVSSGFEFLPGSNIRGNTTHFEILSDGIVYMVLSGRGTGSGNSSGGGGDWQQQNISPEELAEAGWKPVGQMQLTGTPPSTIYERQCSKGERFTYSWEKYIAPALIVLAGASSTFGNSSTRTFSGHTKRVASLAFSPDGKTFVSGSHDYSVKLWKTSTGQVIHTLTGHTQRVASVAFSPDGRKIATGSYDRTIKLWDAASGQELRTFAGHSDAVLSVAFNAGGTQIVSGSNDKTIRFWNVATGEQLRELKGHTYSVNCLAFSPDGRQLASGSGHGDTTIKLWDVATGQEIRTFTGHRHSVNSIAFSRDGTRLVSGSSDQSVQLWEVPSGARLFDLKVHENAVNSVAFVRDDAQFVSAGMDGRLIIWETSSGNPVQTLIGHTAGVTAAAYDHGTNGIASGSDDGTIMLWDLTTYTLKSAPVPGLTATADEIAARRAAEWVLSVGGIPLYSVFGGAGQIKRIQNVTDIPKGAFDLKIIQLGRTEVRDADLQKLRGLTQLTNLELQWTQINGSGLAELAELPSLISLNVSDTRVTDDGMAQLAKITSLSHLVVNGTLCSDRGVQHLVGHPSLAQLGLSCENITDGCAQYLKQIPQLSELSLQDTSISDAALVHLKEMQNLEKLTLQNTKITDAGLEHLAEMDGLIYLNVRNTKITDGGLEHVGKLKSLTQLFFQASPISDDGLKHLAELDNVGHLELVDVPITDAGMVHLKEMSGLTQLVLQRTKLTDVGLMQLQSLPKLTQVRATETAVTEQGILALNAARKKAGLPEVNVIR